MSIQLKTTKYTPIKGYSFTSCKERYKNMLIICMCLEDEKMWFFDGKDINLTKINIGKIRGSKYDVNEVKKENLINKLNEFYEKIELRPLEDVLRPISYEHQIEHEYRLLRLNKINHINFIEPEFSNLIYDFKINNLKIQEKVCSKKNNRKSLIVSLHKNAGSNNNNTERKDKKKILIPYDEGDNDFYWFHLPNKKEFYLVPEYELIKLGKITTKDIYGNKNLHISYNDDKAEKKEWEKYLFQYDKLDKERFNKLLNI